MSSEITGHYSFGGLRERIEAGLAKLDGPASVDTLGAVDEFHVGGRMATKHLVEQLDLVAGDRVIDVGSGLGGTARYMAATAGAKVTGVDLTEEYVEVAGWLTDLVGLSGLVSFVHASAADLPAVDEPFAAATMVHVGMNIADKTAVFADVANQLGPVGVFGVYDLMIASDVQPEFPVPWASSPDSSFLESPASYVGYLEAAGFSEVHVNDRTPQALQAFDQLAASAADGPSPLGLHLVMGPETPTKFANMVAAVRAGAIVPTEIIARR